LKVRALFLGFSEARVKRVVSAIEATSLFTMEATVRDNPAEKQDPSLQGFDAIFVSTDLPSNQLRAALRWTSRCTEDSPTVLVYGSEPDGRAFMLASRYDAWLFSEMDRLRRGLTPQEVGERLWERLQGKSVLERLIEVSLCSGPCSTGH
jgi:hypothetical protein